MASSGGGVPVSGTPVGATQFGSNSSATASMPAVAGKTNYCTGFEVTAAGATAASVVVVTLTGVTGGPWDYVYAVPAGAAVGAVPLIVTFPNPIPATGPNTAIFVNLPALGAGNLDAAVTIHGYVA